MGRNVFLVIVSPDSAYNYEYGKQDARRPWRFMPSSGTEWWTANTLHTRIHGGDLLLFKFSGRMDVPPGIYSAGIVVEAPDAVKPDHPFTFKSGKTLTSRLLRNPIWPEEATAFFGRGFGQGILEAKPEMLTQLMKRLGAKGPTASGVPESATTLRKRRETKVTERNGAFARSVRSRSQGRCAACPPHLDYGRARLIECAHIRPVSHKGIDDLSNALPLCPTHHALFDRFLWTVNGSTLVFSSALSRGLRRLFGERLHCPWTLDQRQVKWHSVRFAKH